MTQPLRNAALLLSVMQFFFVTAWTVYVTFLGDLLEQVGIGREHLIGFIILDQAVYVITDTLMGYAADRVERWLGRLGPTIIGVNLISCGAFLLLPFSTALSGTGAVPLFVTLLVVWIATSSVLRAPAAVLLMKHAARPQAPALAALMLLGLALGGAVSPYLGFWLTGASPYLPFVVSALSLAVVTLGLARVQRIVANLPAEAKEQSVTVPARLPRLLLLYAGTLLLALGFQVHYFLNTEAQYLRFLAKPELIWVLPLFWIGFKLLVNPGSAAARRYGPLPVMAVAALGGGIGLLGCVLATNLETLVIAQLLAGGAWGVVFMAGISAALNMGSSGREGLVLGAWFTTLSVAMLLRALLVAGGVKTNAVALQWLEWVPILFWALGVPILYYLGLTIVRTPREASATGR